MRSLLANGWRYGLVKADHYRPIEEQNIIQPLLTIPLVIICLLCENFTSHKKEQGSFGLLMT
jgi:hypothetical protein